MINMKKKKISIIVPCYNEEEAIPIFLREINKVIKRMSDVNFELIFIDDGSVDNTFSVMEKRAKKDKKIKYLQFSRNFGKEAAMLAGMQYSTGDYVTIMDVDLQDPPHLIIDMYRFITEEHYDCVATKRINRKGESFLRNLFTNLFYKMIKKMSKIEMVKNARDYRMMTRQVVNAILQVKEYNRYSKGLFSFVGFKTKWIEYEDVKRSKGHTKWSFLTLFSYAIEGITSYSTLPLLFSAFMGLFFCLMAFILIIVVIVKTLIFGDPVSGWPSLVCIILFISGIQLFCIGIVGEYLSKTYLEAKRRPLYFIKDTNIKKTK